MVQDDNTLEDADFFTSPQTLSQNTYFIPAVESTPEDVSEYKYRKRSEFVDAPNITIQEIIPEIKEIPITTAPKFEVQSENVAESESEKVVKNIVDNVQALIADGTDQNTNDLIVGDTESDSSEISEVYHHPPPVLKIGDQVLVLKKGELVPGQSNSTPQPVITVIGAEGLQRGVEEKDSAEVRDVGNTKTENDIQAAPSTHIFSLVKRKTTAKPTTTAETPATTTLETFTTGVASNETEDDFGEFEEVVPITEEFFDVSNASEVSTVETETSSAKIQTTKPEDTIDQNPAYPPIPDVMSQNSDKEGEAQPQTSTTITQTSQQTPETESRILPEILENRDNSTIPKEEEANPEWLKHNSTDSSPTSSEDSVIGTKETLITIEESSSVEASKSPDSKERIVRQQPVVTTPGVTERSKETLEDTSKEDSSESTTRKNEHASVMLSAENASVEGGDDVSKEFDTTEVVETLPEYKEPLFEKRQGDVELKDTPQTLPNKSTRVDVEIVDTSKLKSHLKLTAANSTTTTAPKVETTTVARKTASEIEDDKVFKQLKKELDAVPDRHYDPNLSEDENIFRELLEDAAPKTEPGQPQETEMLQRVSDAISRFTIKQPKQNLDTGLLGILTNFFNQRSKY